MVCATLPTARAIPRTHCSCKPRGGRCELAQWPPACAVQVLKWTQLGKANQIEKEQMKQLLSEATKKAVVGGTGGKVGALPQL